MLLTFNPYSGKSENKPPTIIIDHFNLNSFRNFLRHDLLEYFVTQKEKPSNGILVKFLEPKGNRNCIFLKYLKN